MPGLCQVDAEFIRTSRRPGYEALTPKVWVVDLFYSGGGFSLGLAEAAKRIGRGIEIAAAVEQDPDAADVFELNFPGATVTRKDVASLFGGALGRPAGAREAKLAAEIGKVDVLLAGPPCQGHSDLARFATNLLGFGAFPDCTEPQGVKAVRAAASP